MRISAVKVFLPPYCQHRKHRSKSSFQQYIYNVGNGNIDDRVGKNSHLRHFMGSRSLFCDLSGESREFKHFIFKGTLFDQLCMHITNYRWVCRVLAQQMFR